MNLEQARHNMIEQQIRPWDVLDTRVLTLIKELPREAFVPPAFLKLAYADIQIPLGEGEVMMEPKLEARMMQELDVRPKEKVLEVGTGSGYVTALLARAAKHVYSVDVHAGFTEQARARLAAFDIANVTLEIGDASRGWNTHGPYDAIAVTGSLPVLPEAFQQSLAMGGRLFVVVGEAPIMEALLITRVTEDAYTRESLFETNLRPLVNAHRPERFVF